MLDQKRISSVQHAEAVGQKIFLVGSTDAPPPANATLVHPVELQSTTQPYFVDYVRRYLVGQVRRRHRLPGRAEGGDDPRPQSPDAGRGSRSPKALSEHRVAAGDGDGVGRAGTGLRQGARRGAGLRRSRRSTWHWAPARRPDGQPQPTDGPICLAGGGSGRQPGSAFKVFTLAGAFEEGIGPRPGVLGAGHVHLPQLPAAPSCTVKNVESGSYGSISLREATENSVNTVYAQLVGDVGITETAEMAHRLGITMVVAGRQAAQRRALRRQPHPRRGRGLAARHGRRLQRPGQPGQPVRGHTGGEGHRRLRPGAGGQHQAGAEAGAGREHRRQRQRRAQGRHHQRHRQRRRHRPAGWLGGQDRERRPQPGCLVRGLHARPCPRRSGWATADSTPARSTTSRACPRSTEARSRPPRGRRSWARP